MSLLTQRPFLAQPVRRPPPECDHDNDLRRHEAQRDEHLQVISVAAHIPEGLLDGGGEAGQAPRVREQGVDVGLGEHRPQVPPHVVDPHAVGHGDADRAAEHAGLHDRANGEVCFPKVRYQRGCLPFGISPDGDWKPTLLLLVDRERVEEGVQTPRDTDSQPSDEAISELTAPRVHRVGRRREESKPDDLYSGPQADDVDEWDAEPPREDRGYHYSVREGDAIGQKLDAGVEGRELVDELVPLGERNGRYSHGGPDKEGAAVRIGQEGCAKKKGGGGLPLTTGPAAGLGCA